MFASRHWPYGASFLTAVLRLADLLHEYARPDDHNRLFASYKGCWRSYQPPGHFVTDTPRLPTTISAHTTMRLHPLCPDLPAAARMFIASCSALPGVGTHGLIPHFAFGFVGGRPGVGQGELGLKGPTHQPLHHSTANTFGTHRPFHEAGQHLLTIVDALCDHTPDPDAPVWQGMTLYDPKNPIHPEQRRSSEGNLVSIGGLFQANTQEDARVLCALLHGLAHQDADQLIVLSTPDPRARDYLAPSTTHLLSHL